MKNIRTVYSAVALLGPALVLLAACSEAETGSESGLLTEMSSSSTGSSLPTGSNSAANSSTAPAVTPGNNVLPPAVTDSTPPNNSQPLPQVPVPGPNGPAMGGEAGAGGMSSAPPTPEPDVSEPAPTEPSVEPNPSQPNPEPSGNGGQNSGGMGTGGSLTEPEPVPGVGGQPAAGEDCDPAAVGTELLAECTGDDVIECVFGGEPGQYEVSLVLGGDDAASTRVLAEARRFMVDETATAAGEARCVSFSVNVREPEGQPIQDVSAGTPGLNLRLDGSAPSLRAISVTPADPVVLYIAGDSTVCDQDPQLNNAPEGRFTGWGQMLPMFFKRGISVTNYADSGEGTAAFRTDGGSLWGRIDENLKANDWVLIQLGHNDKMTAADTYRSRIQGMVDAVRAKGAFPVLISPMVRNTGGDLGSQHIYGDLNVREVLTEIAMSETVPFIDLMALSDAWVNELGRDTAQTYFVGTDQTHSNELGARVFAEFVVNGMLEQGLELTSYLRP